MPAARSVIVPVLCAATLAGAIAGGGRAESRTGSVSGPAQGDLPTIYEGRPRLLVGGFRGQSAEELRAACAHEDMRGQCDEIANDRGILPDAMRFLLFEDRDAAARVRSSLLSGVSCGDGAEYSAAGGHAIAYDWVADTFTPPEKTRVEGSLATCGTRIAESLHGNGPHLWHGFTAHAAALALVALAIDDGPARQALLADAVSLFRRDALEAYEVVGGAWPEGYSYERSHFFSSDPPEQYVLDAVRAWNTAVMQDSPAHASIVDTIRHEEGDWLSGLAYHLVYGTVPGYTAVPQRTLLRGGDIPTGQAFPNKQFRPFVDAIAVLTGDPVLKGWGVALENDWPFVGGSGTYHPIHRYALPLDLPTNIDTAGPDALPLARVWAKDEVGAVIARSGWGATDTLLTYRAGKWFTGHQHMDQGHIDLWRSGPLAVDSGVYADWGSDHRELYYMRSAAHNTLLIDRPGETFDQHPAQDTQVNDGGQRIHTYRGCPQCMQSVAEWRSNIDAGLHLEAATLETFHDQPELMALTSDLTGAYNSTRYASPGNVAKVESVQRDLVFVRPGLVLVVDRVLTLPGTQAPRFVLHLPTRPSEPVGTVLDGSVDDGILEAPAGRFVMDNGSGGRLIGRTLLPEGATMHLIGGSNFRYWVDGSNRLDGARAHETSPAEPGIWRVEVQGSEQDLSHTLVHALTVTDDGGDEIETAVLPVSSDPAGGALMAVAAGAPVHTVTVFSSQVPRGPIGSGLIDLPGAQGTFRLVIVGVEDGTEVRAASSDGVQRGVASGGAWSALVNHSLDELIVGACPAPDDASDAWLGLCRDGPELRPLHLPAGFAD